MKDPTKRIEQRSVDTGTLACAELRKKLRQTVTARKPSDPLTREKFLKPLARCVTGSSTWRVFFLRLRQSVSCAFLSWNCYSVTRVGRIFTSTAARRGDSAIRSAEPTRIHGTMNSTMLERVVNATDPVARSALRIY